MRSINLIVVHCSATRQIMPSRQKNWKPFIAVAASVASATTITSVGMAL